MGELHHSVPTDLSFVVYAYGESGEEAGEAEETIEDVHLDHNYAVPVTSATSVLDDMA